MGHGRSWSTEEDSLLKDCILTDDEVSRRTGRTPSAVKCRRSKLGLPTLSTREAWTEAEDKYLSDTYFLKVPISTIAASLRRSVPAVYSRAFILGIRQTGSRIPRRKRRRYNGKQTKE